MLTYAFIAPAREVEARVDSALAALDVCRLDVGKRLLVLTGSDSVWLGLTQSHSPCLLRGLVRLASLLFRLIRLSES